MNKVLPFSVNRKSLVVVFFLALIFQVAVTAATTGLPWETPIGLIAKSLTGPVALGIALAGIMVIGGGMIFRPDIFDLGNKAVLIPLIVAVLLGTSGIITTLFPGLVGAVV